MQGWQHIQVTQEGGGLTGNYRDQDRKRRINTLMRASVGFTGKGSSLKKKKKKKTENLYGILSTWHSVIVRVILTSEFNLIEKPL